MKKVATLITSLLKAQIKKEGLYDTGRLYNSIKVDVLINSDGVSFEVLAEDYFEYLDNKYKLMDNVLKNKSIDSLIEAEIAKIIEKQIKA